MNAHYLGIRYIYISVSIPMSFTSLHVIYCTYLLLAMSVLAHPQQEYVVCGINSYPFQNGTCTCLPGFVLMDNSRPSKGCHLNPLKQLRCNPTGSEMERIEKVNWPEFDYDIFKNVNDTECGQACMEDSMCTIVIYNNDLQQCWKKSMPLPGGRADNSSIAFVKVYKSVTVLPMPSTFPCTPPKQRKENGKALVIIGISLVCCSFVFAVILLLIWLYTCRPKLKAFQQREKLDPVGLKASDK